jgi:hypothetical protein
MDEIMEIFDPKSYEIMKIFDPESYENSLYHNNFFNPLNEKPKEHYFEYNQYNNGVKNENNILNTLTYEEIEQSNQNTVSFNYSSNYYSTTTKNSSGCNIKQNLVDEKFFEWMDSNNENESKSYEEISSKIFNYQHELKESKSKKIFQSVKNENIFRKDESKRIFRKIYRAFMSWAVDYFKQKYLENFNQKCLLKSCSEKTKEKYSFDSVSEISIKSMREIFMDAENPFHHNNKIIYEIYNDALRNPTNDLLKEMKELLDLKLRDWFLGFLNHQIIFSKYVICKKNLNERDQSDYNKLIDSAKEEFMKILT